MTYTYKFHSMAYIYLKFVCRPSNTHEGYKRERSRTETLIGLLVYMTPMYISLLIIVIRQRAANRTSDLQSSPTLYAALAGDLSL